LVVSAINALYSRVSLLTNYLAKIWIHQNQQLLLVLLK
jgi:hypothetical protein